MKIAIPLADGRLSLHFGHCEEFALLDVDPATKSVKDKSILKSPPHEPGVLPRWLGEKGATVIIAGGMGQRAQGLFAQQNIEVVVGASSDTPEEIVKAYLDGTLKSGANLCDH
jgi:predicted Fe-Mo cluster-binding NifX family protein